MNSIKHQYKVVYRNLIRYLNHINSPILKWFYRFTWSPKPGSFAAIFDEYSKKKSDIQFLQIGANDGMVHDPVLKFIRRDGWKGVLVEPQKHVFKQLEYLHSATKGVHLVNAAISHKEEIQQIYKISFSNARWATGLTSFEKTAILNQIESGYVDKKAKEEGVTIPSNIDDYITSESVQCLTLKDIIDQHNINQLDILQIDTEGFDFEIIKMVDFEQIKPHLISFERAHLSEADFTSCVALLKENGYHIYPHGRDAIAFQDGAVNDPLILSKLI